MILHDFLLTVNLVHGVRIGLSSHDLKIPHTNHLNLNMINQVNCSLANYFDLMWRKDLNGSLVEIFADFRDVDVDC